MSLTLDGERSTIPGQKRRIPLEKGMDMVRRKDDVEVPGARFFGRKAQQQHQQLQNVS